MRLLLLLLSGLLFPPSHAFATELPLYVVGGQKTISGEGDVHVVARSATLNDVSGDVFVFGKDVAHVGVLEGDLSSFAQSVFLSGRIRDDARIIAHSIRVAGSVDGHLIAVGGLIEITPAAEVDDTVALVGKTIIADGRFTKAVTVVGDHVTLSGEFRDTVTVLARESFTISPDAIVHGSVDYMVQAGTRVSVGDFAYREQVRGRLLDPEGWSQFFFKLSFPRVRLSPLLSLWIVGGLCILCFPGMVWRLQKNILSSPVCSFSGGVLLMLSALLLVLFLGLPFLSLSLLFALFVVLVLSFALSLSPLVLVCTRSPKSRQALLVRYTAASCLLSLAWVFFPWLTLSVLFVFVFLILGAAGCLLVRYSA